MNYIQTVQDLESRGVMPERAPTLEPMQKALALLMPHSLFNSNATTVVAGTNGKGSICATLEALFLSAGETVGLFTSPHLEETTERIRINGQQINEDLFCRSYQTVIERTKGLEEQEGFTLSHFEVLTLMAAWIFYSGECIPPVKRPIFEVGLGGTWDATNAIPHQNCIISSLSYDHQNLLGNTLTQIALNKFGIISSHSTVVHSPFPDEIKPLAQRLQTDSQNQWIESIAVSLEVDTQEAEPKFSLKTPWGLARLSLPGLRAAQNTATALTLFHELGYSPQDHLSALAHVKWPGRMEKFILKNSPCPLYLSGDHNPDGIQSLLQLLPDYRRNHLFILAGVGRNKDLDGILSPLSLLPNASIFLTVTPFQGRSLEDYGKWLDIAQGGDSDPMRALEKVISQTTAQDMIIITGSLYLVGELRRKLRS